MNRIDWKQVTQGGTPPVCIESTMSENPSSLKADTELAALEFPNRMLLTIEWKQQQKKFLILLLERPINSVIFRRFCSDVEEVKGVVREFSRTIAGTVMLSMRELLSPRIVSYAGSDPQRASSPLLPESDSLMVIDDDRLYSGAMHAYRNAPEAISRESKSYSALAASE